MSTDISFLKAKVSFQFHNRLSAKGMERLFDVMDELDDNPSVQVDVLSLLQELGALIPEREFIVLK